MPTIRTPRALAGSKDDRWLAEMTRCIFQAGFVWRVLNNKWHEESALPYAHLSRICACSV